LLSKVIAFGLFTSVGQVRPEIVLSGRNSLNLMTARIW
jgi:hypothetical protein